MKYYIRQIKPYIKPPILQGINCTPYPVSGYDWVPEDLESKLRAEIVVSDSWSELVFAERYIECFGGANDVDISKETIEEIIGISIKAVTNIGRVRTVHLTDFQNEKGSTIAFKHYGVKSPREQIVATINCDHYLVRVE